MAATANMHDRRVLITGLGAISCLGTGNPRWSPLAVTAAAVSAAIGTWRGNASVGNACSAGGYALGIALDMIWAGTMDSVYALLSANLQAA